MKCEQCNVKLDINNRVKLELEFIYAKDRMDKDVRAMFQRARLKALAKNPDEHAFETIVNIGHDAGHVFLKSIRPELFLIDIRNDLEMVMPNHLIWEENLTDWERENGNGIPWGTVAIIKNVNYDEKKYSPWSHRPTKDILKDVYVFAIQIYQSPGACFNFNLSFMEWISNDTRQERFLMATQRLIKIPVDFTDEFNRYLDFKASLRKLFSKID